MDPVNKLHTLNDYNSWLNVVFTEQNQYVILERNLAKWQKKGRYGIYNGRSFFFFFSFFFVEETS